jgi:uncharacterized membrane protein
MTAALLDAYVRDWLDLALRWLHVIAAMAWIGTSFYFVLLDQSLRRPRHPEDAAAGVAGELWEVHGGGFYHVQKYRLAPAELPGALAWFKWEAYTTWLSGFALLVVFYYLDAATYLVDPQVADLDTGWAVAISAGLLAAAWALYDALCRLLAGRELLLATSLAGLTTLAAWGAGELFSPRAAWLQVGAMLGTIMAGNVLFSIIPAHRGLIRARGEGREPDPAPGLDAKRRSVHNNYLTLPVLLTMLAGHFAFLTTADHAWVVLVAVMAVGAWARLFFNLRHRGRTHWWMPAAGAAVLALVAVWVEPDRGRQEAGRPVAFAEVAPVIAQRCAPCHARRPTQPGFSSPPAGVALETPDEIARRATAIAAQVASRAMPLGNVTGMTDEERELTVAWARGGDPTG